MKQKDSKNNLVDGMLIEEDIILEIVRPGTSNSSSRKVGEIVVTKINTDYPMIRLATGDLSKILVEPSPCGRTNYRIQGWMGRAEQSTNLKEYLLHLIKLIKYLKTLKIFQKLNLLLTQKDLLDNGELLCETDSKDNELKNKIKDFFKNNFKLNINISLVKEVRY